MDNMFESESLRPAIELILRGADRDKVSAKMVRKELHKMYPAMDLKTNKESIDDLTLSIFNHSQENSNSSAEPEIPLASSSTSNHRTSVKREHSPDNVKPSASSLVTSPAVPLRNEDRKPKREEEEISDEQLARQLALELNPPERRTRGANTNKPKRKVTKKAKSKRTIDEDGEDDGAVEKKKRKVTNTGFNKLHRLSQEMAQVCGEEQLSRPQVVKQLWAYIKGNELQDPSRKTEIILDEKLSKVFPGKTVNAFTMQKYLGKHLFPIDEIETKPKPDDLVEGGEQVKLE